MTRQIGFPKHQAVEAVFDPFCFGIHTKKAHGFGLEETRFSFKTPTQVLTRQATVLGSVTTEVEVRPLLGLSVTEQYGKPSDGWNMETHPNI